MDLIQMIQKVKQRMNGRPLSDKSMKIYVLQLKKLNRFITGSDTDTLDSLDFIYQTDKINEFLEGKPISTKRAYYSKILALLNYDQMFNEKNNQKLIERYVGLSKDINQTITQNYNQNILTEKQQEKLIPYSQLINWVNTLKKDRPDLYILVRLVMNEFYRNEVGSFIYISLKAYKRLVKQEGVDNLTKNYLIVGSQKVMTSRNDYKTYSVYGNKTFELKDKALNRFIRKYIRENSIEEGKPLFDFSFNQVSTQLAYNSKKSLGVELSTSSIFKITIGHYIQNHTGDQSVAYLKRVSQSRGTDMSTLTKVYLNV